MTMAVTIGPAHFLGAAVASDTVDRTAVRQASRAAATPRNSKTARGGARDSHDACAPERSASHSPMKHRGPGRPKKPSLGPPRSGLSDGGRAKTPRHKAAVVCPASQDTFQQDGHELYKGAAGAGCWHHQTGEFGPRLKRNDHQARRSVVSHAHDASGQTKDLLSGTTKSDLGHATLMLGHERVPGKRHYAHLPHTKSWGSSVGINHEIGDSAELRGTLAVLVDDAAGKSCWDEQAQLRKTYGDMHNTGSVVATQIFNVDKGETAAGTRGALERTMLFDGAAGMTSNHVSLEFTNKLEHSLTATKGVGEAVVSRAETRMTCRKPIPAAKASCLDSVVFGTSDKPAPEVPHMQGKQRVVIPELMAADLVGRQGAVPGLERPDAWDLQPRGLEPANLQRPATPVGAPSRSQSPVRRSLLSARVS